MIAVLPKSIVAEEIRRGGIIRLPLAMAAELDSYGIVTPRGGSLSDNAKEFVGIVRGLVRGRP
jgi:DNA-binding transcriptional LysR family regulator